MRGTPEVIDELNKNLKGELTAINQYTAQAGLLKVRGYKKLAESIMGYAKQEREHSEELIERVMFLQGELTRYMPDAAHMSGDVHEMLASDLSLERQAFQDYNDAARVAAMRGDNGSRELFVHILKEEEEHIQFFEGQLLQIAEMGIENYLASQV